MEALDSIQKKLDGHTAEEMERYQEIIDQQDQLTNKVTHVEKQVCMLTGSINAFIETNSDFFKSIKKAFPKDDEGHPDFDGHRTAHLAWIKNASEERELMTFLKQVREEKDDWRKTWGQIKLVIWGAVALGIINFVAPAVWTAFVVGPK